MIKHINKQNLLTTPFVAAKSWDLYNVNPLELVLTELTGSEEDVALEYVDYTVNPPTVNRDCNIALEQQSSDRAIIEEGISGSGTFLPNSEIVNPRTNTFKRLVYDQTQKAFYNSYRNPLEIFGLDNIDFPLGKTNRFIADRFIMFTIPTSIFGERMKENTIQILDDTFDDNLLVTDDGYGNLIAGKNLFSKVQEVRHFANLIFDGTSSFICGTASVIVPPAFAPELAASQISFNEDVSVTWTYAGSDQTDFLLERSFDSGSTWPSQIVIANPLDVSYDDTDVTFGETIWYRISAHNSAGYGPLSNTASVFIEQSNNCPFNSTLLSGSYGIQGYFDGLIQNPVVRFPSGVTWTGSFVKRRYFPNNLPHPTGVWVSGEVNQFDIDGQGTIISTLRFLNCTNGTSSWEITINDGSCGEELWVGTGSFAGDSPVGVYDYEFDNVGNGGPATLTIISLSGSTDELVDGMGGCS